MPHFYFALNKYKNKNDLKIGSRIDGKEKRGENPLRK